jgi:hypothetical protein
MGFVGGFLVRDDGEADSLAVVGLVSVGIADMAFNHWTNFIFEVLPFAIGGYLMKIRNGQARWSEAAVDIPLQREVCGLVHVPSNSCDS